MTICQGRDFGTVTSRTKRERQWSGKDIPKHPSEWWIPAESSSSFAYNIMTLLVLFLVRPIKQFQQHHLTLNFTTSQNSTTICL